MLSPISILAVFTGAASVHAALRQKQESSIQAMPGACEIVRPDELDNRPILLLGLVYAAKALRGDIDHQLSCGPPRRDLITAARLQLTSERWRIRRPQFEVYVSQLVLDEAAAGDPEAASRRVAIVEGLPLLEVTPEAVALARRLIEAARMPPSAYAEALHIATAAFHGMDYLLTWNSTHITNEEYRPLMERACRTQGFEAPVMCTPDELMGGGEES